MSTDASLTDLLSTPTMAGLFFAGLSFGAVYALGYTRLGKTSGGTVGPEEGHARASVSIRRGRCDARGDGLKPGDEKSGEDIMTRSTTGRKRRRVGKSKGKRVGGGQGEEDGEEDEHKGVGEGRGAASGTTATVPFPCVIPGDFEGVGVAAGAQEVPLAELTSKQGVAVKTQEKRKTAKKQKERRGKAQGGVEDEDKTDSKEVGEAGDMGRPVVHARGRPRSDDSTEASAASGDASRGASHVMASTKRPLLAPSLSFDTDSSWTHVDHRRIGASISTDPQTRMLADAIDATSSGPASMASDSSVAERMGNVKVDMRGTRADQAQRTLAERLVPRPRKTGVEDMLEQPDVPTLARVMRVQPPADETPVPGFSWDDYGDVVEDSILVHDADEEDEGEWGVVKSRHRIRSTQPTTTASTSTSHTSAAQETMSKKQRQNARKRELAKAAKAEAEAARLQGLAKHKRELERLRIIEQSQKGGGKRPSGGMQAMVDDRGKLVWE